ncbi:hypothetical protein ACOTVE_09160, partial [Campylobacter jejuni]|uniref:hypothetical protein n=1 Tax=Campylobacter jejuni TaxID=197 RepID=UPI003BA1AB69
NMGASNALNTSIFGDFNQTHNYKDRFLKHNAAQSAINSSNYDNLTETGQRPEIGGPFSGGTGAWRFIGYNQDGSSLQDALFPPEYEFPGIANVTWYEYANISTRLFNTTSYDEADWDFAKRNLINRLMDQNPEMQRVGNIDKWMKILSLQTEPVLNPYTGLKDGNYGAAYFAGYRATNGRLFYKTFAIFENEGYSAPNLNLTKYVVTRSTMDENGNYPVIATIERKEAESRVTINEHVYGKIYPGEKVYLVSYVKNQDLTRWTAHRPATVNVGYDEQYSDADKNAEKDGRYREKVSDWTWKGTFPTSNPTNKNMKSTNGVGANQVSIENYYDNKSDVVRVDGVSRGQTVRLYKTNGDLFKSGTANGSSITFYVGNLGDGSGAIDVTVQNPNQQESDKTRVNYGGAPNPVHSSPLNPGQIEITNFADQWDRVRVNGIGSGDIINLYRPNGGSRISGITAGGSSQDLWVSELGDRGGSIDVTIRRPGELESDRTNVGFGGEPNLATTDRPSSGQFSVTNNRDSGDVVHARSVPNGTIVRVYNESWTRIGEARSNGSDLNINVGNLNRNGGTLRVTFKEDNKYESPSDNVGYGAQPADTPNPPSPPSTPRSPIDSYDESRMPYGSIGAGKTQAIVTWTTLSNGIKDLVRFGSVIDDAHRLAGDNLNPVDDDLMVKAEVETGNIKAKSVELVDENGKVADEPLPGHRYKVRYTYGYKGIDSDGKIKVKVDYRNTQTFIKPTEYSSDIGVAPDEASNKWDNDTSTTKQVLLRDGKNFTVDTKYLQWYEIPKISTRSWISSEDVPALNTKTNDDYLEKTWEPKYDYSVKNLQVLPHQESVTDTPDGKQTYGVSFTAVNDMPPEAKRDDYAQNVTIDINVNGVHKRIKEHLVAGENKRIVTDVVTDALRPGSEVRATVRINADQNVYESGDPGFSNNTQQTSLPNTSGLVINPRDPRDGVPADHDTNSWTQPHGVT